MKYVFAILSLAILTVPANSQNSEFNEAQTHVDMVVAREQNDYETACKYALQLAEHGSSAGVLQIADCYERGRGVEQNTAEAVKWYEAHLAHADNEIINMKLAQYYADGVANVERNYERALHHLNAASEQGNSLASYNAAVLYENGLGTAVDHQKALERYLLASEKDHIEAVYKVGLYYQQGIGTEQNFQNAIAYFNTADRLSLEQNNHSHGDALASLGIMLINGQGVNANPQQAAEYFTNAKEAGNARGAFYLGIMYQQGVSGLSAENQNNEALKNFEFACRKNYLESCFRIGLIYIQGSPGIEQNAAKGVPYLERAARSGHAMAQFNLAIAYYNGVGVDQDKSRAYTWATIAQRNNLPQDATPLITQVKSELTQEEILIADQEIQNWFQYK